MRGLYEKYKYIVPYLFFGVCTTLVNIFTYWLCAHACRINVMPSTIVAWISAVLFAYITNRKWVFHSKTESANDILKEMTSFFMCRLGTGLIDWVLMYLFVDCWHFNDVLIKIIANVIVIVLNYIASKLLIFKKRGK